MELDITKSGGKKLFTKGKLVKEDILVKAKLQTKAVTKNGTYNPDDGYAGFSEFIVGVPNEIPDGYVKPTGVLNITENGEYIVTNFERVNVQVETGGGGGECTGTHINIVNELPETGVSGEYYGIRGFADAVVVQEGQAQSVKLMLSALGAGNFVLMQTTQEEFSNDMLADGNTHLIYFTNIPDIYANLWGSELESLGMEFLGEIADMSQADTTKTGIYALVGVKELYQCVSGEYIRLLEDIPRVFAWHYSGSNHHVFGILPKLQGEHIVIPSTYEGNPVTGIWSNAFEGELFTSIEIPESITFIDSYAFKNCYGLKEITLPNDLTEIDIGAFYNCVGFTDITIPDKVERIREKSFRGCINLNDIVIPSSVTKIDANAFEHCIALTNITFNGTTEQWTNITFGADWNKCVPATKVTCSDGEVTL